MKKEFRMIETGVVFKEEQVKGETILVARSGGVPDSPSFCEQVESGKPGLEAIGDCAGQWTHAVAWLLNDPYKMDVVYAVNVEDALRRAKKCRSDVTGATYYFSPVMICAPYILCTA